MTEQVQPPDLQPAAEAVQSGQDQHSPVQRGPVQRGPVLQRSALPDVLRGLALLGILVVNMQDFAGMREWQQQGLDRAAQVLTDVFANGRFISIFAMLFGWGAAGLLSRQGVGVFLRRHLILLLIGSLHFVFVWHGDIIANYALLALALLLTSRMKARPLLITAAALGIWWLLIGVLAGIGTMMEPSLGRFSRLPDVSAGQSYVQMVAGRTADLRENLLDNSLYNGPWLVALFLLGVAAQRTGLLLRPQDHLPLLRRLRFWGLLLGLPLGALLAYLNTKADAATGMFAIPVRMGGGLLAALGYVGWIGVLTVQGRLGVLTRFAASGRVAMSNYLAQSLVMTSIFYPYAGAQWGTWGAASTLALALLVGLAQLPISAWWLARYGSGPIEWVVRSLVYGLPRKN